LTFLSLAVELKNLHKTTVAAGMTRQIVTLEEVAQCLGLEEESLESFVATGQIPFTQTPRAYVSRRMPLMPLAIRWIVTA